MYTMLFVINKLTDNISICPVVWYINSRHHIYLTCCIVTNDQVNLYHNAVALGQLNLIPWFLGLP